MRIGIVGAGRIGGNCAAQFAKGGHEVKLSSRDPSKLEPLAAEIGDAASLGTPAEAAEFGQIVVIAVPWDGFDDAVESAGSLDGKIVIDTTNQYGSSEMPADGQTAASFKPRAWTAPATRSASTPSPRRSRPRRPSGRRTERIVQWVCGDDDDAKQVVMGLIEDAGYEPVDLGGTRTPRSWRCRAGPERSTARSAGCRRPRRWSRRLGRGRRSRRPRATR